MANRKISDLTALTAPATGDLLPIVDISEAAAADKNKKITYGELLASAPAGSAAAPSFSFDGDPNTGVFNPAADTLAFAEGGVEAMRIDSSGRLLVGTATANTSGAKLQTSDGLTFPATAVASADPNTLDDYEEGTWTPIAGGNATDGTATYALQNGTYTKVGRMVTIHANLSWTSCTATGNIRIRGLPFTSAGTIAPSVNFGYQETLALPANAFLSGFVHPSATFITPQSTVTGGGTSNEIAVDAAAVLYFSATYFTS
jgi:hypothetical protein